MHTITCIHQKYNATDPLTLFLFLLIDPLFRWQVSAIGAESAKGKVEDGEEQEIGWKDYWKTMEMNKFSKL